MTTYTSTSWMEFNQLYLVKAIQAVGIELVTWEKKQLPDADLKSSIDSLEQIESELTFLESQMTRLPAILHICKAFGLSDFERKVLLMCAGVELDSALSSTLNRLQNGTGAWPTFSMALATIKDAHWSALSPENPLLYWRMIRLQDTGILTQSPLRIDEQILHYLAGLTYIDSKVNEITSQAMVDASSDSLYKEAASKLSDTCRNQKNTIIQIRGDHLEEKRSVVHAAFPAFDYTVLDMKPAYLPSTMPELIEWARIWNRSIRLAPMVLMIEGSDTDTLDQAQKHRLQYCLDYLDGIVIIESESNAKVFTPSVALFDLESLSKPKQQELWRMHLGDYAKILDGSLDAVLSQFNLSGPAIKMLSLKITDSLSQEDQFSLHQQTIYHRIWSACVEHTRPSMDSIAQRIQPLAYWDDLVLPEMEKSIVGEIATHVRFRQKVYEDWAFAGKSNRGLGISALFAGESGTGKTMAAEVLANELKMDLYRIDLSQVVNKYIGETEKNLKKIFDRAENSGAILLFDEADALFGKRSEIKDSHDRYANIEVSYLLQRMEEYKGLSILTTNMKNALDKAFMRRIRFVVQFPFPDMQMRMDIWRRIFPLQTPTENLDWQKLAALNIAGGNIRNIALHASFYAAANNRPVTMTDLQLSARKEYLKLEKNMSLTESMFHS